MANPLCWQHVGPEREAAIELPGIAIGNQAYALVYDPKRDRIVYVYPTDYGQGTTEIWTSDGSRWERTAARGGDMDDECHAYFDTARGGVVYWTVPFDHTAGHHVAIGTLIDAAGARPIATSGDPPSLEIAGDSFHGALTCAIAYDATREVAVCLTRNGVWELDRKGAWARRGEATGLPAEWHNDAGGTWDPITKRCVFWIQGEANRYKHVLLAWNGAALEKLPLKGLPDLCFGLFSPCAMFVGHPEHGLVCEVGGKLGMYRLDGASWTRLPAATNPPPKIGGRTSSARPRLAYHDKLRAFVIGPGHYEGDPGGADAQRVFWLLRGDAWQRQGVVQHPSEINAQYGRYHAVADGTWYSVYRRGLHTFRWEPDGWREIVSKEAGEAGFDHDDVGAIAGTPDGLVAVSHKGAVYRLEGSAWKRIGKPSPAFKQRSDFELAWDGARLVAWGGEVKNRKSNDTFVFDGKAWTQPKQSSPIPKDRSPKEMLTEYPIIHDAALGRLVRFGYKEVATLEAGDVWAPAAPKGYKVGSRWYQHMPAHDPVTGETVVVDFDAKTILRFDLGGCPQVATFEYPPEIVEERTRDRSSVSYYFYQDVVYDPATRSLHSQQAQDKWGRSRLDLAPAFEAAKALRPRKLLGAVTRAAPKAGPLVLYRFARGKVETWRGDAKQLAAKAKAGFVPALELSSAALEALGTVRSSALAVKSKQPANHATSRIGGLPSGITAASWPRIGKRPLGFLLQLVTGDRLGNHAGVAVFCTTDGTATEDESHNRAVLLSPADLKRAPLAAPPDGVPVLAARTIDVAEAQPELDEETIEALVAKDPDLGAAFERYQAKARVQDPHLASKLGGAPVWLQDEDEGSDGFVAQLDFDVLSTKGWDDAGLMGCVYVYVNGAKARALWQYT